MSNAETALKPSRTLKRVNCCIGSLYLETLDSSGEAETANRLLWINSLISEETLDVSGVGGEPGTEGMTALSSDWPELGYATETSSGQYQFIDPDAASLTQRFYVVRASSGAVPTTLHSKSVQPKD